MQKLVLIFYCVLVALALIFETSTSVRDVSGDWTELQVQTDWTGHCRGAGQRSRSPYGRAEAEPTPAQGNVNPA